MDGFTTTCLACGFAFQTTMSDGRGTDHLNNAEWHSTCKHAAGLAQPLNCEALLQSAKAEGLRQTQIAAAREKL